MLPLTHKILLISIVVGQLIKLPIGSGGATLLDLTVVLLCGYFLIKNKFRLTPIPIWVRAASTFILIAIWSWILSPLNLTITEKIPGILYIARFSGIIFLGWLMQEDMKRTLLLSGVILAILGLLQFIFIPDLGFLASLGWDPHFFRTASTFLDPNFLGAFLVLTLLLVPKNKLVIFALVYLALLTTFSRGAYLAFLATFLTLSITKRSLKLGFITLLLFAGLMLGFYGYQMSVATPRGVDRVESAEARLDTWQQGTKMFLKAPILGVGFNLYRPALKEYKLADEGFIGSHGAGSNDSSLLFVASTTGIIGLAAYSFFLGTLIFIGIKKNPILLAGLVGLLTQSFFANTLFYPFLLLYVILLVQYLND
jgi:O-antigen ligase